MLQIISAHAQDHYQKARELFRQYADSLGFDLEFQGFSRELATLPGAYDAPQGCILLAEDSGHFVGCVALRPLGAKICEMKRLYVSPKYRGRGIGRMLACSVIDKAREAGYEKMRLDTIASMKEARTLYYSLEFRNISAYRFNPLDNPSYMELDLKRRTPMRISLIVAMAANRVIGSQGGIPWKIPGEQKMFKAITMGHAMIMGRKTYEAIGCALPGRTNIVITRQADYQASGCKVVHDLEAALQACPADESEAFIIGGGQLYRETITIADRIYLTVLPWETAGDTYFPEFSESDFEVKKSEFIDGVEPYHFYIYERITEPPCLHQKTII
jgi:dihydrofolate reductase